MMTIEQQALALVNEVRAETGYDPIEAEYMRRKGNPAAEALCRALERHEADKQAMSEAFTELRQDVTATVSFERLEDVFDRHSSRFIITPPIDPLAEALKTFSAMPGSAWGFQPPEDRANVLRAALAKHGLAITGVE